MGKGGFEIETPWYHHKKDALTMIPEFAVIGHPNEGKSSVVSTLTENDRIKVSRFPGETIISKPYTVKIDGQDIIRFIDTPGFQVPRQTLAWFRAYAGPQENMLHAFIEDHKNDEFFSDECELLSPVAGGAGIIYVVDGSRPVREDDLAEMEILRLSGRPRIAIINSKSTEQDYTSEWKQEFLKQFNAVRVFNSNTAGFSDRMKMLESLKVIDQDWESALTKVIRVFRLDWQKRNRLAAGYISEALETSLTHKESHPISANDDRDKINKELSGAYRKKLSRLESGLFKKIRDLYKHHLYDHHLPEHSILQHDLFSSQTWELLGLTKRQLAAAGAVAGGTMGAVIDTAAAGITFGVFSAIGGVLGAGSTLIGAGRLSKKKIPGLNLGGDKLQVGPNKNPQFLYILMDRILIYYSHIINRPHGRRDKEPGAVKDSVSGKGYSSGFSQEQKKICNNFLKSVTSYSPVKGKKAVSDFNSMMESVLNRMSN